MSLALDGILLVDKPRDWTSHDVCAFIRKRFRIKKVGHAGTLDPLATGLLVILLGQMTKLSNTLTADNKEYEGTMELGIQTSSHDRQGEVLKTGSWEAVTLETIRGVLPEFTGDIFQVPPMVSALKHKGVRLYELARKGQTVERESRPVTVYHFEVFSQAGPLVTFRAEVSKGTYVRTLVNDVGERLGCHATLAELKRTRSGRFRLADAVSIETLRGWSDGELSRKVLPIKQQV